MSSNLILDKALIEQLELLSATSPEFHGQVISLGVSLLEGKGVAEELQTLAAGASIPVAKLGKICSSSSSLIWECSKFASKDQVQAALQEQLCHSGLSETVAASFCKVFQDNKRRLLALKGALGVSAYSYRNLAWRLEVELSKRTMHVMSEPKYLLRLDLADGAASALAAEESAGAAGGRVSYHLQADHSNMKLLEQELQRAVDEISSVHVQRINRYMS